MVTDFGVVVRVLFCFWEKVVSYEVQSSCGVIISKISLTSCVHVIFILIPFFNIIFVFSTGVESRTLFSTSFIVFSILYSLCLS